MFKKNLIRTLKCFFGLHQFRELDKELIVSPGVYITKICFSCNIVVFRYNLDEMYSHTFSLHKKNIMDNIFNSSACFDLLKMKATIKNDTFS